MPKNNDTCGLWGVQDGSFFKPPAIKSVDQAGGQKLEPHFCWSGKDQLLFRAIAVRLHDCSVLGHGYVTSTLSLPPTKKSRFTCFESPKLIKIDTLLWNNHFCFNQRVYNICDNNYRYNMTHPKSPK